MTVAVSKRQIDRAGERIRTWWFEEAVDLIETDSELQLAATVVIRYRRSFQYPLRKVTVGLRQFVARDSSELIVGQRLKRLPTLVDKLRRHPDMKLSRMQDIGGCRAILPGGENEMRAVLRRIVRNWDVTRIYDYIVEPKTTGYRGIHVVVRRDESLIEIQLRTPGQHEWALAVERTAGRLRLPQLKDGEGPPELARYFNRAAYAIALVERGSATDKAFEREFEALRTQVQPYLQRPTPEG